MKRAFDLVVSAIGLILLSPLLIILSLLIWLQDYKSPFYVASRTGRGELPYEMIKFRSMVVRADKTGVDSTAANDPRITAVGRFIRRFKLDELPQLWNVFKGQMSLVGPRPPISYEVENYPAHEVLVVRDGDRVRRLPMVRAFVERVDLAAGVVVLRPWEEA